MGHSLETSEFAENIGFEVEPCCAPNETRWFRPSRARPQPAFWNRPSASLRLLMWSPRVSGVFRELAGRLRAFSLTWQNGNAGMHVRDGDQHED